MKPINLILKRSFSILLFCLWIPFASSADNYEKNDAKNQSQLITFELETNGLTVLDLSENRDGSWTAIVYDGLCKTVIDINVNFLDSNGGYQDVGN